MGTEAWVPVGSLPKGTLVRVEGVPDSGPTREAVVERGVHAFYGAVASHEGRTVLLMVVSPAAWGWFAHYVTGIAADTLALPMTMAEIYAAEGQALPQKIGANSGE